MTYAVREMGEHQYIEILPGEAVLASEQDVLDWVGVCGEHRVDRLMFHAANVTPEFYDLKSGLLGAILLKLSNYRIRTAAVLEPEQVEHGRFHEFTLETNRGSQFRIFYDRAAAAQWLTAPDE